MDQDEALSWDQCGWARQYYQYGRAKRQMARKHPDSLRWRRLAAPAIVIVVAGSVPASILWPWVLLMPLVYVMALEIYAAVVLREAGHSVAVTAALATMDLSWGARLPQRLSCHSIGRY